MNIVSNLLSQVKEKDFRRFMFMFKKEAI